MDTLQCAILLAKLEKFEWEAERRNAIGVIYNQLLDKKNINRIKQWPNRTSVYAQYTVIVENRSSIVSKLQSAGIPTSVHYPVPINLQPAYKNFSNVESLPIAEKLSDQVMSIPMHPFIDLETQEYICNTLEQILKEN
jgi:UDP-2-acetamido-2-deoxy-ribo-hexuluronate aminotransferase